MNQSRRPVILYYRLHQTINKNLSKMMRTLLSCIITVPVIAYGSYDTQPSWNRGGGIALRKSWCHQTVSAHVDGTGFTSENESQAHPDVVDSNHALLSDGALSSSTLRERYSNVLPRWLVDRCEQVGYIRPTRIQERALDVLLLERESDVVIQAETGSGKTLCFVLPILATIDPTRSTVQALIIVPTRELGLQVARVTRRLAVGLDRTCQASNNEAGEMTSSSLSSSKRILIMSVLQGSQNRRQRAWAWAEPPHVVIGTPQEVNNMLRLGAIKRQNSIRMVVVDEVDACLLNNAGSFNVASLPLHEVLAKHLSPTFLEKSLDEDPGSVVRNRPWTGNRQTIFCSATIPQYRHFLKQCTQNRWTLKEPLYVCSALTTGEQFIPPTLEHLYMVCAAQEQKMASLRRVVQRLYNLCQDQQTPTKVLVFAEPRRPMEDMACALAMDVPDQRGVYYSRQSSMSFEPAVRAIFSVLRYENSLSDRAAAIHAFTGESAVSAEGVAFFRVLFSTDLASRGLDIANITHVIHFDLPPDVDTYVHRAGRSGRLGRSGQVLSIVSAEQEFVLQRFANKLGVSIKCIARQQQKR